ncbi:glycosyltransferase WbuB [Arthrobacter sp. MYb229]|uniref:glycosyltransferase family 4 protein n=1 Tax=unclassified Arthrobacter TaxID=235627 RepID=UPI000CFDC465|nr:MULTISPECIES: glycosyltransferase family 4 protein [unclassified Arthrobacter]PRA06985.1 glycosyltransferase WbuB [Arthrobacter sp. MYb229]PRB47933.1 glycosyltransferase WbuB [Arthrobacter sp. MYb216]
MKIMLLTHSFSPEISPPQRRWSVIADELTKLGHELTVVAPQPWGITAQTSESRNDNERIHIKRYRSLRKSKSMVGKVLKHGADAVLSVPAALNESRPDVVVATVPALPTLIVGYVVSKIRGVPFVVDLRDAWPDLLRESQVLKWRWLEPVVSHALSYLVKRSDLLVTVTRGLAVKMRLNGVSNVATISNGVEIERPEADISNEPRNGALRVLYLGNIGRSQGLDTLIHAAKILDNKISLRIVGNGTEKRRLIELAAELDADVDFRESVYGDLVLENYAWADTCVVSLRPDWPSFDHTVPSKLYELLYLDRHITGLVRGEAAGIITAAESGQVVGQSLGELTQHLKHLAENPDMLKTYNHGSHWVRKNASLREAAKVYAKLLSEVVTSEGKN